MKASLQQAVAPRCTPQPRPRAAAMLVTQRYGGRTSRAAASAVPTHCNDPDPRPVAFRPGPPSKRNNFGKDLNDAVQRRDVFPLLQTSLMASYCCRPRRGLDPFTGRAGGPQHPQAGTSQLGWSGASQRRRVQDRYGGTWVRGSAWRTSSGFAVRAVFAGDFW
ncbi:unnamed protein product [Gadus morhua 'NCC']